MSLVLVALLGLPPAGSAAPARPSEDAFRAAAANGARAEEIFRRTRRMMQAWLAYADARTLLLPDFLPGYTRGQRPLDVYTPHNSGADNYPYLVATAFFTDRPLFEGRMREMLRNEVRYTAAPDGVPGELNLKTGALGPPSLFGAAEYAKDGLVAVTELLGRTPWFYRMADMISGLMARAPVPSAFGPLPDAGAELNGDVLQALVRLAAMTGDRRYLEWAERIGDAYVREVMPGTHGVPGYTWDFARHDGPDRMRLRDHGNEMVVGLALLHALETDRGAPRAESYRPALGRMLDRVLASANPDGMLYNEFRPSDLAPLDRKLSDNWGYVYGAVYTHFMATGEPRFRDAVRRVLRNLPRYRGYDWENGSHDGYADAIESALYLYAREPVPEAREWIESEMETLIAFQRADGTIERWYGDGNWARTLLLYAMWKTQGCRLDDWREGVRLGAVREGDRLFVSLEGPPGFTGRLRFDYARHRRELNFARDYVRLNEWPEWFTVDENTLYRVVDGEGRESVRSGSELKEGIEVVAPARLTVEALIVRSAGEPPAAATAAPPPAARRRAFLDRFARAYFPGRTGQIMVVPREGHFITRRDPSVKYMHGSPWPYDARIPFLIHGPAFVRPGTYPEPATQQDMAPTLAALLGAAMPGTSTGRPLGQILLPGRERPRLILLAVLDGMRPDYFDRHVSALPTFTRLRTQGAWFSNAEVSHAPTITSIGHATIATGAEPRVHGIVANSLFDRVAGRAVDSYPGLSPRLLMALSLADVWNVQTAGRAVVIGQGSTARAMLPLAGHGACWFNGRPVIGVSYDEKSGGWETNSECYRRPDYLEGRNARTLWEGNDGLWMGHAIASPGDVRGSGLFSKFETDALKLMIEREPLGADDVADLVLVNLKTPDYVGHRYGPDSPETREALGALDRDLAGVLAALDAKVGRDRYVVAITADHGMPPEPDRGRGQDRHYTDDIVKAIHEKFDPQQSKLVKHYEPENAQIAIDGARLQELGLSLDALARYLEAQAFIFAAYTEQEVGRAAATLAR